jgi:regulator of protease activity HflC (stomatin/prohibitin superfamily)
VTIGELIAALAEYVYGFWPLRVVSQWEQGCLVRAGQVRRKLTHENGLFRTGVHFFVPQLDEIFQQEANSDTVLTPQQAHVTADGKSVAFNFAVRWRVVDVVKLFQSIHEAKDTLIAEIVGSAGGLISTIRFADAHSELADQVYRDIAEQLEEWGVELEEITLANFAQAQAVRLITGS